MIIAALCCVLAGLGARQDQDRSLEGLPVLRVEFVGDRERASDAVLRTQVHSLEGSLFSWANVDRDQKALYERLALRAEVSVKRVEENGVFGVAIAFAIAEPRAVRKVEFRGNRALNDAKLREALGASARGVFGRGAISSQEIRYLVRRMRDAYEEEGYLYAEIKGTVIERDEELVLDFEVVEGPKVRVGSIRFFGLREFSEGDLRGLMSTKQSFLFLRHTYKPKVLEADLLRLENFLRDEGYLDARVSLERVVPRRSQRSLDLELRVVQGEKYRVGTISFAGNDAFSTEELRREIRLEEGRDYRRTVFQRDFQRLTDFYGKRGYIRMRASTTPAESAHLDQPVVDVVYAIEEGLPKRVRDVRIVGNRNTSDDVVRRELELYPGQVFDTSEIDYTLDRLRAVRAFIAPDGTPKVFYRTEETADPDFEDLILEVEEGQSGFFNFVAGLGSGSGVFFGIAIDKENFDLTDLPSSPWNAVEEFFQEEAFHGGGQQFSIRANPGSTFSNWRVGFVEPAVTGPIERPVSLDVDAYLRESTLRLYDEDRYGVQVGLGKAITRDSGVGLAARVERIEITNVEEDVPDLVAGQGKWGTRALIATAYWRRLDSIRNPTRGLALDALAEWLGGVLGGDVDAYKAQLGSDFYQPLYENSDGDVHYLQVRSAVVYAAPFGDTEEVPFFERFYAGGLAQPLRLRGFDFRGVGPHQSGEPVGGTGGVAVSTDYVFPIFEKYDANLREHIPIAKGVVFFDQGTLATRFRDIPDDPWRTSVGVGMRLRIPVPLLTAPLEIYYGVALNRASDDEREGFTLSLSTRF